MIFFQLDPKRTQADARPLSWDNDLLRAADDPDAAVAFETAAARIPAMQEIQYSVAGEWENVAHSSGTGRRAIPTTWRLSTAC